MRGRGIRQLRPHHGRPWVDVNVIDHHRRRLQWQWVFTFSSRGDLHRFCHIADGHGWMLMMSITTAVVCSDGDGHQAPHPAASEAGKRTELARTSMLTAQT